MGTAATFDALKVPPLAHAMGHLVILVLVVFVSGSDRVTNINDLPLALTTLDCLIYVG